MGVRFLAGAQWLFVGMWEDMLKYNYAECSARLAYGEEIGGQRAGKCSRNFKNR